MGLLRSGVSFLALGLGLVASAPAEQRFTITSRSLATIYVDGGSAHGLKRGDRLRVLSGAAAVGELEVVSTAERWSVCRTVSLSRPIARGDVVIPAARSAVASPPSREPAKGFASLVPRVAAAERPAVATPTAAPTPRPAPTSTPAPASSPALAPSARPTPTPAATPATTAKSVPTPAPAQTAPPTLRPAPSPVLAGAAPISASGRSFTVKYRSAANVYLDAGRAAGLGVGDRLRVASGPTTVAELQIAYAAELSASCTIVSETRPVHAGDIAVLVAPARRAPAAAPAAASVPLPPSGSTSAATAASPLGPEQKRATAWGRVRGSASLGYYRSWDQTASALDFEERTARLDLGVYDIAGQPLSFTLRGRSRQDIRARTLSQRTPASERTDRLYEVALRYEPPSDQLGLEIGRIGIYRFVGVGYLDGVLGRFRPLPALQLGGFAGRIADIETLGFGGTGSRLGAFVRLAPGGRYATGGYDAMLAFVRENADGDVSREYLSLESHFGSGSRWSIFQRAELDLNTGWRGEVTGKSYQLSNVSLSGNLRVASSAWAFVSYDGRRNYRYYLNRVVPEEVFDDLLHQGLRAGLNVSRSGGFGATAGVGMSLKEPDPRNPELEIANAYSFNAGLRHSNLFSSGFSAGIDGSGFSNGYTDGGLLTARVGHRFPGGHVIDLSIGRSLYRLKLTEEDRTTQWLRLMGRAELGYRVYMQGDLEYDAGDDLKGPRGFLELGILF
jgi:hypothetical protein